MFLSFVQDDKVSVCNNSFLRRKRYLVEWHLLRTAGTRGGSVLNWMKRLTLRFIYDFFQISFFFLKTVLSTR